MSRARALCVVALALGCASTTPAPGPQAVRPAAVVTSAVRPGVPQQLWLISVAGLTPAHLAPGGPMPTLASLARAGVRAERMEAVAPAQTYPADATLVTGVGPREHGVVANHLLGDHGVRAARYDHVSLLRAPTLWQRVAEHGGTVAAIDWPSTLGAQIAQLLPAVTPTRREETWTGLAADGATPWIAARLRGTPLAELPGPDRDAFLVDIACEAASREPMPRLVLLRLTQTAGALSASGPGTPEEAVAFHRVDDQLARVLGCIERAGRLADTALVVVGDAAREPIHSMVRPNVALAAAGFLEPPGTRPGSWKAIARSNGGSAFVYAHDVKTAVAARSALTAEAARTGAFRVVPAEEMIAHGADPQAWFGLEAAPGFAFDDASTGLDVEASPSRAAAGYLDEEGRATPAFVAWGRGFRPSLLVPSLRQEDVAPTLAALLGLPPPGDGRTLVGLIDRRPRVAAPPVGVAPPAPR